VWTTLPIIGFDTETTGVDPAEDRLVTCSLVRLTSDGVERMYWLADPGVEIPERATAVHGISTEYARTKGRPITEVLAEISHVLVPHLAAGYPAVAFNASYDFTLLESELERHGLPTLAQQLGGKVFPVVDPYLLDRSVDQYRRGKRHLEHLCTHYGVTVADDFHNAEADVVATLRLLGAMMRQYPQLASTPLQEIVQKQEIADREFVAFLNRRAIAKGRPARETMDSWPVRTAKRTQEAMH
jgi:DNA polymerase-3 subunit epsilon